MFEISSDCHDDLHMLISFTESYFNNHGYRFLEKPMLILLALLNENSAIKRFPVLRQKSTHILP